MSTPLPGLPLIAVPHTGGPPTYPTREQCGLCRKYARAVRAAEEAGYPKHAAAYRDAWAKHDTEVLHKEAQ
ncbi:hypothetical protein AB0H73_18540 [Streptomyces olivoreticuli]